VGLSENNNGFSFGASPGSTKMEPMHAMKSAAVLFGVGALEGIGAHALTAVVGPGLLLIVVIKG
jgi:hypothetical protein